MNNPSSFGAVKQMGVAAFQHKVPILLIYFTVMDGLNSYNRYTSFRR